MGMDFTALLKYRPFSRETERAVNFLESKSLEETADVVNQWHRSGYAEMQPAKRMWVDRMGSLDEVPRPKLPSLDAALFTPEAFYFTFGIDTLCVYHPLRWHSFLTEVEWQNCMLKACTAFAKFFGATEAIVTSDFSRVIAAFFKGLPFDQALQEGKGNEGEVSTLSDLYQKIDERGTWDSHGFWRFLKEGKPLSKG
jgi:hypothetical protein